MVKREAITTARAARPVVDKGVCKRQNRTICDHHDQIWDNRGEIASLRGPP